MLRIEVSDVAPARERKATLPRDESIASLLAKRVEASYASDARLVVCNTHHPLAQAAHDAFYEHRPLLLSPDTVWFCLAQGLAQHVNLHVERLRSRFVRHEGRLRLLVERADFELGRPNPWPEAFAAFSEQIAGHVGKLRDLIVPSFSTTTPTARAAAEVTLMDAFQGYFEYELRIGCGIPSVILLGTPEDWRSIRTRAQMFAELELEHWTSALLPVLDQIVASAEGRPDREFWQSFFRYESASGPSEMTGWIHVLFPHLVEWRSKALVPNPHIASWRTELGGVKQRMPRGPSLAELPSGLASAPVLVTHAQTGARTPLRFVGGLFGVIEDEAGALAPELGWAIVYEQ